MCEGVVEEKPKALEYVSYQHITQEMCGKAAEKNLWHLLRVPDNFKTQEMCKGDIKNDLWLLQSVCD